MNLMVCACVNALVNHEPKADGWICARCGSHKTGKGTNMTEAEKVEKEKEAKAKAEAEAKAKAEAEAKAKAEQEAKAQAEKAAKSTPKVDLPKVESIKAAEKWFLGNTTGILLCVTKDGKQFEADSFPKAKKWFFENGVEV